MEAPKQFAFWRAATEVLKALLSAKRVSPDWMVWITHPPGGPQASVGGGDVVVWVGIKLGTMINVPGCKKSATIQLATWIAMIVVA